MASLVPTCGVTGLVFDFLFWGDDNIAIRTTCPQPLNELNIECNMKSVFGGMQTCSAFTHRAGEEHRARERKNYYGKPFIPIHVGNRNSPGDPMRARADIQGAIINHEKQMTRCR